MDRSDVIFFLFLATLALVMVGCHVLGRWVHHYEQLLRRVVLAALEGGARTSISLRSEVSAAGLRVSGREFYRVMDRLVDEKVVLIYDAHSLDRRGVPQIRRWYALLDHEPRVGGE